jgi:ComF family protein
VRAAELIRPLADLVFPRACVHCGQPPGREADYLCWDCLSAVHTIVQPYCSHCGDPVDGVTGHDYTCSTCKRERIHFECARSAARYSGPLKTAVQTFKYRHGTWLARDLGMLLLACVRTHFRPEHIDAIAAVPLFPKRERFRHYNQAYLLARRLAGRLDKPLLRNCLVRTQPTVSQVRFNAAARRDNIHNAFATRNEAWIDGRRILLVDDVMTTGSTVNECARVLKEAGAAAVRVATVARG